MGGGRVETTGLLACLLPWEFRIDKMPGGLTHETAGAAAGVAPCEGRGESGNCPLIMKC